MHNLEDRRHTCRASKRETDTRLRADHRFVTTCFRRADAHACGGSDAPWAGPTTGSNVRNPLTVNGSARNGRQPGDVLSAVANGSSHWQAAPDDTEAKRGTRIDVHSLGKRVWSRDSGRPTWLLQDISMTVAPREFVGILGMSGSGKSTLIDAINGRRPASTGQVLYDNRNLYEDFDTFKQGIGYVPQRLIIHDRLPLTDALRYAGHLRMPADSACVCSDADIDRVLETVKLTGRRETRIAHLSGGEQKRAAIAVELLSRPSVLFLDEATSGLDQLTETLMMQLFRSLADGGVTTVCVSHYADSLELCDKIVYLVDGHLAFYGHPEALKRYFDVGSIREAVLRHGDSGGLKLARAYRDSPYCCGEPGAAVAVPAPTTMLRRPIDRRAAKHRSDGTLRQFATLTRRNTQLLLSDWRTLLVALVLPLVIGLLGSLAFAPPDGVTGLLEKAREASLSSRRGAAVNEWEQVLTDVEGMLKHPATLAPGDSIATINRVKNALKNRASSQPLHKEAVRQLFMQFMVSTSIFCLGIFGSIREIVKERSVYMHERFNGLRLTAYLASKLVPLAGIAAVQVFILQVFMNSFLGVELVADGSAPFAQYAVLFAHALVGVVTGLLISALSTSEAMAVVLMIAALIPQLTFCNALRPLEGSAETIGRCFVAEYRTLDALQALTAEPLQVFTAPTLSGNIAILVLLSVIGGAITAILIVMKDQTHACPGLLRLFRRRKRRGFLPGRKAQETATEPVQVALA